MTNVEFDREFRLVTSYAFSPIVLCTIRLLVAFYAFVVLVFILIWEGTKTKEAQSFFSYFTNLTYIGICAYFFASGVQTFFYARSIGIRKFGYPLQRWPRYLRFLHTLLLSTVITFPILVTIVYWALLAGSDTFGTPYSAWSNISKHAFNSVFALFEILCTNIESMPWVDLIVTILILAGYLGVAYITHATQGFYTYSFLDPKKEGSKLALYIVGIAVGQLIIFVIVFNVIRLRKRLTARKVELAEVQLEKLVGKSMENTDA